MKTLQISCVSTDWDSSGITATGRHKNGRLCIPETIQASTLESPWIDIWHAIVGQLQSLDPNGWAAELIICSRCVECNEDTDEETGYVTYTETPYIELVIHRKWDDNTTAEPLVIPIYEEPALLLFDHLTQDI